MWISSRSKPLIGMACGAHVVGEHLVHLLRAWISRGTWLCGK
jgi:hypothetical protein